MSGDTGTYYSDPNGNRYSVMSDLLDSTITNGVIETNEKGGRQSKINTKFYGLYLIPEYCLNVVIDILLVGKDKYGLDNWKLITTEDHINHAMRHLYLFLSGDTSENHLGNACCRCLFALYTHNNHV